MPRSKVLSQYSLVFRAVTKISSCRAYDISRRGWGGYREVKPQAAREV